MFSLGILAGLLILPLVGAAFILTLGGEDREVQSNARSAALATTVVTFLLSLWAWAKFDPSTAAFQPGPKMAVYFATKAFVLSLSEALHEELKPHGIKVSCLCPGPTRTEFGEVAGFGGNSLFDRVAMNAGAVVEAGLKGLDKNRAVVVAGWLNKLGAASTRFAPRAVVRKIAGAIKY